MNKKLPTRTSKTKVAGIPVTRGANLPTGKGWRLLSPGGKTVMKAALLTKLTAGKEKLAIFRVLPNPSKKKRNS